MLKVFSLVILLNGQIFEGLDSWLSIEDCVAAGLVNESVNPGIEWVCEPITVSNYFPPAD